MENEHFFIQAVHNAFYAGHCIGYNNTLIYNHKDLAWELVTSTQRYRVSRSNALRLFKAYVTAAKTIATVQWESLC